MYKIVKVLDKNGNIKQTRIDSIKLICPEMTGEIIYKQFMDVGNCFCFLWSGDSQKMMRTSPIESVSETMNTLHIVTENTEYFLEKITGDDGEINE